jgi:hypothetical protein
LQEQYETMHISQIVVGTLIKLQLTKLQEQYESMHISQIAIGIQNEWQLEQLQLATKMVLGKVCSNNNAHLNISTGIF